MVDAVGNLIIALLIIGSGVLITWVNVNYQPGEDDSEPDNSSEDDNV